jgi:O-antigen/teichoic acid export membrane protein
MPPDADSSSTPDLGERPGRFQLPRPLRFLLRLFSGRGAREGYLASIDQAIISLANFVATVILARLVSPTELGVYGVGFTSLRLVRSIQEGLVIQPINTFGSSMDLAHFRRYVTSASIIQFLIALSSSVVVAIGGWVLTRMGNDIAGPALYSLWFTFLFWQLQEHLRRVLYTRGDVLNAVINTALANGIRLVVLVWWAARGELTGIGGLHAIAWGSLAALVPGLWQTRSYWTADFANLIETWRKNWDFGRWILGGTLANWVSIEFYPVLTAGMISFAAAGAYRALQNLVAPIHLLLRATDTFLTPRAARLYAASGKRALIHNLRLTYLIAGIPIFGFLSIAILFPVPLLRLLYGETYVPYSSGMVLMAIFYALVVWLLASADGFESRALESPDLHCQYCRNDSDVYGRHLDDLSMGGLRDDRWSGAQCSYRRPRSLDGLVF